MKLEKIVVAPDSFKGTMSAYEVCLAVRQAIDIAAPGASVSLLPVADGGEGSIDCLISAVGGEKRNISVNGPFFEPVDGFYAVLDDGTAVVEAAACDGLVLAGERKSAADATSCGIGETILAAIKSGCKRVLLCIGGTASNDGGCGMAAALGVKFYRGGEEFVPVGRTLCDIDRIDVSKAKAVVGDVKIDVLCDVDNPFYGKDGAAFVFAPQKGVKEGETEMLDDGMRHLAEIILRDVGADVSSLRGAGAAGGIGGGAAAFLGASLLPGAMRILDAVGFDKAVFGADLVITGEGKFDAQSAHGKVVSAVAARAASKGVPVAVIAGQIENGHEAALNTGVWRAFAVSPAGTTLQEAKTNCREKLVAAATEMINELKNERWQH